MQWPLLIVSGAFSQPSQPRSEQDRAADMKKRVIETLHPRPGDTAADVGCGDGFHTIPLAAFSDELERDREMTAHEAMLSHTLAALKRSALGLKTATTL